MEQLLSNFKTQHHAERTVNTKQNIFTSYTVLMCCARKYPYLSLERYFGLDTTPNSFKEIFNVSTLSQVLQGSGMDNSVSVNSQMLYANLSLLCTELGYESLNINRFGECN